MALNAEQQKQFDTVCERIADGKSLRKACIPDDVPTKECIRKWLNADEDGALVAQYMRARDEQADEHADGIIDIADDKDLTPDDRRVRIDARKWVASKLKPRKYGDKQQHEHSGQITMLTRPEDAQL